MKLVCNALVKFFAGLALVGLLIFLPAGSLGYWQGWLFMGLLFVPMFVAGLVLLAKNPTFLEKRLDLKEKQSAQKGVVALSGLMFIAGFVVAGLDFRFGWSVMPHWVTVAAATLFLLAYALYAEVMRENAYLSRTVEVQQGQRVVDTGLYGIVRHPMYAVTLWLFLSIPMVLGSWWSLLCFAPYIALLVLRIRNEEAVLTEGLPGYAEYKKRVKYRLMPFVW